MNGDHWLLYMSCPADLEIDAASEQAVKNPAVAGLQVERPLRLPKPFSLAPAQDQTLEILMTHLSPASCARFQFPSDMPLPQCAADAEYLDRGHALGMDLSSRLGLAQLFPTTALDAFAFEPCGYSANAVIPGSTNNTAGYWTVHVTPEEGSSYASFETNIGVRHGDASADAISSHPAADSKVGLASPDSLPSLVERVVTMFEPGKMSVTLFVSSTEDEPVDETVADNASLLHRLELPGYGRSDRIAYEFEGYDLVFVSFEKGRSSGSRRMRPADRPVV